MSREQRGARELLVENESVVEKPATFSLPHPTGLPGHLSSWITPWQDAAQEKYKLPVKRPRDTCVLEFPQQQQTQKTGVLQNHT